MSDRSLQIAMKEEDSVLFKRCVRKLLESTFLLEEKDEKLYRFAARESNRYEISQYLKFMGFDILGDEKSGVAMLVANEEDEETVGLKRANVITFNTLQYHLLLVLWEVYLENLGYEEGNFVTRGDLIDKIKSYGVYPASTDLKSAFKLFKKYNLIDFDENETGEEANIQLYPSLQFGWDVPQFRTVAEEYIKTSSVEEGEEPDSEFEEESQ